jgi:predicted nuclease with TOPRIM domain
MNQAKEEIEAANKRTEKVIKEKNKVLQETKELREAYDKLNEQVKALQCKHIDLEQKVTKEPRVFSGQTFVS